MSLEVLEEKVKEQRKRVDSLVRQIHELNEQLYQERTALSHNQFKLKAIKDGDQRDFA